MNSEIKIFSCGPSVMMESLKDFSNENNIDCDLALETVMACGFGICQGCTVEYSNGQLESQGSYVDDKKDGRWVSYNKTGEKVSEVVYAAGELINN